MVEQHASPWLPARREARYGGPDLGPIRRPAALFGVQTELASYAAGAGFALDGSCQSVAQLDAHLSRIPAVSASKLLHEIGLYLGDLVASRAPRWQWILDRADYPMLELSAREKWDVVRFVHRREEGGEKSLSDALEEMVGRATPPQEV